MRGRQRQSVKCSLRKPEHVVLLIRYSILSAGRSGYKTTCLVSKARMAKFDYAVRPSKSWPPSGRPEPPFGPGALEILRSCALRGCFDVSPGYERRIGFAARIGTAYH